jgi:7,8-dihydropterin-6-yl-methyl-4-(beta-D-ribofuranosyl)aminobenzene 5'-phosphate synthase
MTDIHLRAVDRIAVTVLVDNYSDLLLADSDTVKRLRVPPPRSTLAEHGLSYLISVYAGSEAETILMDAGISGDCMWHNARMLAESLGAMAGVVRHRIEDVRTVVLSHGHYDHFCGLQTFLARSGRSLPVILHPAAFSQRRIRMGEQLTVDMPVLSREDLEQAGAEISERTGPSTIASERVLVAGQVARTTPFETGSHGLEAKIDGQWVPDPFHDDQGVAIHLKGKGLVVIGGCSHAGIVNTVRHLQTVSGLDRVHAVLGGFHLAGGNADKIAPTISALKAIAPDRIVPMHCTGWSAINRFSQEMPDPFVLNSVGSTYLFGT